MGIARLTRHPCVAHAWPTRSSRTADAIPRASAALLIHDLRETHTRAKWDGEWPERRSPSAFARITHGPCRPHETPTRCPRRCHAFLTRCRRFPTTGPCHAHERAMQSDRERIAWPSPRRWAGVSRATTGRPVGMAMAVPEPCVGHARASSRLRARIAFLGDKDRDPWRQRPLTVPTPIGWATREHRVGLAWGSRRPRARTHRPCVSMAYPPREACEAFVGRPRCPSVRRAVPSHELAMIVREEDDPHTPPMRRPPSRTIMPIAQSRIALSRASDPHAS
jgi:hypothetical protein